MGSAKLRQTTEPKQVNFFGNFDICQAKPYIFYNKNDILVKGEDEEFYPVVLENNLEQGIVVSGQERQGEAVIIVLE